MWSKDQIDSWNKEDLTMEFIGDLHGIVGVDAVEEFGSCLKKERPDLFFPFLVRLQEYYWKRETDNE